MPSLAPARSRATSGTSPATPEAPPLRRSARVDALLGTGLAAALVLVAFLTKGGVDLAPNTWVQIALAVAGVALAVTVLTIGAPGRAWGAVTLALFAALAALTAISIAWSVQPDTSWLEANRAVSYLGVFGGAIALARLFPERWPAIVGAVGLAATLISGYALLVKVFPASFDPQDALGRLHSTFDYWNATGLMAALGLPACLWAGASRRRPRALGGLAVMASAVLVAVVILSYSRSALLAAIVSLGCWFVLVPLRLRGVLILALGAAAGAVVAGWALSTHALTHDHVGLHARTSAGHTFGLLLVLVLICAALAGLGAASAMDRTVLAPPVRRRIGTGLIVLTGLVPIAGIAALAASSRGLTGEVSHAWRTLTNQQAVVYDNPGRLVELGSSRARDWSEGFKVGEHALAGGVGARGFATARLRYSSSPIPVRDAHSYVVQTFADLGLAGIGLSLALLVAWALASARTLRQPGSAPIGTAGRAPAAPGGEGSGLPAEREGLVTMLCVVVGFGVNSAIDWTWFIPGTVLPALMCAGWLAGRGPLAAPVGRLPCPRRLRSSPAIAAAVFALVALTLLGAWAMWQPLRSADADAAAIGAAGRGDLEAALASAKAATARNPVSVEPLFELSGLYGASGDQLAARAELHKATNLQPENPDTWLQLGYFELRRSRPRRALRALERARRLDRSSPQVAQGIAQAEHLAAIRRTRAARGARARRVRAAREARARARARARIIARRAHAGSAAATAGRRSRELRSGQSRIHPAAP